MHTTLLAIREHEPCHAGWVKLLRHLGKTGADDQLLPFTTILASNGVDDAIWCMRSAPQYDREWCLFAVFCARQVEHLLTDDTSRKAIDTAQAFYEGRATAAELRGAASASAAANAAYAAASAAYAAIRSAQTAYLNNLFKHQETPNAQ